MFEQKKKKSGGPAMGCNSGLSQMEVILQIVEVSTRGMTTEDTHTHLEYYLLSMFYVITIVNTSNTFGIRTKMIFQNVYVACNASHNIPLMITEINGKESKP